MTSLNNVDLNEVLSGVLFGNSWTKRLDDFLKIKQNGSYLVFPNLVRLFKVTGGKIYPAAIEPGVKINGAYYRDVLLSQHLLPAIRDISGDYYIFQQDSAPAHRARETAALLQRSTPSFISPLH